eukprot:15193791-Alexandrium_andersonii.AAC.1
MAAPAVPASDAGAQCPSASDAGHPLQEPWADSRRERYAVPAATRATIEAPPGSSARGRLQAVVRIGPIL